MALSRLFHVERICNEDFGELHTSVREQAQIAIEPKLELRCERPILEVGEHPLRGLDVKQALSLNLPDRSVSVLTGSPLVL